MSRIEVYGASDDLIEIEGAIREEFYATPDRTDYLVFNEGTVLSVKYNDDGCWEIQRVAEGSAAYEHRPHDNDETTYTDRVILLGDLTSVKLRKTLPKATERTR